MNIRNLLATSLACLALTGCGSKKYFLEDDELAYFKAAGPIAPELDTDALVRGLGAPGPYRVAIGDLLQIRAPRALFDPAGAVGPDEGTHWARVDTEGHIQLPLDVSLQAQGQTLVQLEEAITAAVHPKYILSRPSIVVQIIDYRTIPVTVVGAVDKPGIHELRSDQMSLYGSLSAAGGIVNTTNLVVGASMIRVQAAGTDESRTVVLPVKGLNIPFSNMALEGGETIEVVRYEPDTFTVVGLVNKPGAYDYLPGTSYNLMQAIGYAGGVDLFADPPYATVFRQDENGEVLPATFEIAAHDLVAASSMAIKPGDVIAVQHTPATWTRSLIREVFQIRFLFGDTGNDN